MPEILQRPLTNTLMSDITQAAGWNYPRHTASYNTPGSSDDENYGYWYGSFWVDVTNNRLYLCSDPTGGNAVWQNIASW